MGRVVNPILHATEECLQKGDVRTPVSPKPDEGTVWPIAGAAGSSDMDPPWRRLSR